MIKINNFQGELTDVSAKKETLHTAHAESSLCGEPHTAWSSPSTLDSASKLCRKRHPVYMSLSMHRSSHPESYSCLVWKTKIKNTGSKHPKNIAQFQNQKHRPRYLSLHVTLKISMFYYQKQHFFDQRWLLIWLTCIDDGLYCQWLALPVIFIVGNSYCRWLVRLITLKNQVVSAVLLFSPINNTFFGCFDP